MTNTTSQPKLLSEFLSAFFPDPEEPIRFRAFEAKGSEGLLPARLFTFTRNELLTIPTRQQLVEANQDRGLYFVVNAGGDSDSEISGYNAFFAENDTLPLNQQHAKLDSCPLVPSIRVETLRSVHAYWLMKGDCLEGDWRCMQQCLIDYLDGDEKIKNPSRVMRLPYFDHVSYDPEHQTYSRKPVTVAHFDKSLRYTVAEMQQAFAATAQSNEGGGQECSTWEILNAEARRRIRKLKPTISADGEWLHAKGICHNGKGSKALYVNLDSGAYGCLDGCDRATILKALSLPPEPKLTDSGANTSLATSWYDFARQEFNTREKVIFELEPGEVGALLASTDVGKTTLGLNLCLTLAAGGEFLPLVTRPDEGRHVLYIDGESRKARLQGDIARMIADFDSDEMELVDRNFHVICDEQWRGEPLDLANHSHREVIRAEACKVKAQFIVIDTMSALFGIQNENDNAEVSQKVMRPLVKLAADTGAAILLVHHIGKQSEDSQSGTKAYRGRGASVTGAAARLVLLLKQDANDPALVSLTCAKAKGKKFGDVLLKLTDSRWFVNTGQSPAKTPSNYERVLESVRGFGRAVKRSEIEAALKDSISDSQLGKHLKTAVDRGELVQTSYGHYSTPEDAHSLDAIDNEQVSNFKEGVKAPEDSSREDAHSLAA